MSTPESLTLDRLRRSIREAAHRDEADCVAELVSRAADALDAERRERVLERARALVERCREASERAGTLDAFLREFGLSNREGVALMCLAEALLRVPDGDTADRLISEKVRSGDWGAHAGKSHSGFVNASVWGLMLTGRLVTLEPAVMEDPDAWVRRLVSRIGEPVVRAAVLQAMRIMGSQYVLGRTIEEALERSANAAARFSFDMLGEGARTLADADRYLAAYREAIDAIGRAEKAGDPVAANGISVKLSALHPRYELAQRARVKAELLPRLRMLALRAKGHGLGFSIDAEEAARLELSLELFERLARDPALAGWHGLGFVLQAYQKRAPEVADWLVALAHDTGRRLMVRLVKGAYWDAEIKHAQERGFDDYPVFTRKTGTDLCYEVCATRLLAAGDAIFPQFATHNAHTATLILELAGGPGAGLERFEFQRLHGMGHLLYDELANTLEPNRLPLRIYAPVGSHRELLPYLVRRLLENGANSSFVNRFLDARVPPAELIQDVLARVRAQASPRHPRIPAPLDLYRDAGEPRRNTRGIDLDDPEHLARLVSDARACAERGHHAAPIVGGVEHDGPRLPITSPADRGRRVGSVHEASVGHVDAALTRAAAAQPDWDLLGGARRAAVLERAAELFEARTAELVGLISAEAGRTLADALAEVREAADFCRYYAMLAERQFGAPLRLPGPTGEQNELSLHGRGVFACISPWNFPLAIFTGQVAAALAAGNAVAAKPAEQTPLVAAEAVRQLLAAGVPPDVLHLLPGDGATIGGALSADERVAGVAFTGSIETAQRINRNLAARPGAIVPLIAETGGQNVMLVDSTALPEQVVDDVIASAFQSAGQRCSALRVLYLQQEIADGVLEMLRGAMQELVIGDPLDPATDVGPVIDEDARASLERHVDALRSWARCVCETALPAYCANGTFFPPSAWEIDSIGRLEGEVFGPVLHVIRYAAGNLDAVLAEIRATGYGLTLGVHSRIDGFAQEVFEQTRIGNTYVNRNMIGAVVGVNPFGGQGLSGTGPKAGGPNYLLRFAAERTRTENVTAKGGNTELFGLRD